MPCDHSGLVSEILLRDCLCNCLGNNMQSRYMRDVDREEEESFWGPAFPNPTENVRYTIVIRGQVL